MTDDQREEIARLAADALRADQLWRGHLSLNTHGKTLEERTSMEVALRVAETELMQARARLTAAQKRVVES